LKEKKVKTKKEQKNKQNKRWVILISLVSFLSTMLIAYISDTLLSHTGIIVSFIILLIIIIIGVISDMFGIAITVARIGPFNAKAARKIKGSKIAVKMVKNAPKVSNVCNDVVGDICGIVSGATTVSIVIQLAQYYNIVDTTLISLILSGLVACLTVGGKAIGKEIAMKKGTEIVHGIAIALATIKIFFNGQE